MPRALMASAWEQAAELATANQRLRQLQMSLAVGEVLHDRHWPTLAPDEKAALSVLLVEAHLKARQGRR